MAHGLSAKAPGSVMVNMEHYYVFGTWVPLGAQADQLVKYIKFHTEDVWELLLPEAMACYFMNMKKLIKTFKAVEKQADRI